ncbi:MAG: hypothetical protein KF858_00015 [Candidatus Sumerlaeia bacterium]|nr:hypothetical protein [Candidatus Sumerlaeia bacterium]
MFRAWWILAAVAITFSHFPTHLAWADAHLREGIEARVNSLPCHSAMDEARCEAQRALIKSGFTDPLDVLATEGIVLSDEMEAWYLESVESVLNDPYSVFRTELDQSWLSDFCDELAAKAAASIRAVLRSGLTREACRARGQALQRELATLRSDIWRFLEESGPIILILVPEDLLECSPVAKALSAMGDDEPYVPMFEKRSKREMVLIANQFYLEAIVVINIEQALERQSWNIGLLADDLLRAGLLFEKWSDMESVTLSEIFAGFCEQEISEPSGLFLRSPQSSLEVLLETLLEVRVGFRQSDELTRSALFPSLPSGALPARAATVRVRSADLYWWYRRIFE